MFTFHDDIFYNPASQSNELFYVILSPVPNEGKTTKEEIEKFLKIFKTHWDGSLIPRIDQKNDDALTILGITPKHRAEEIKKLRFEDYFNGPSPDHDGVKDKEWWKFGRYIDGYEIYIKIGIVKRDDGQYRARCMSFHIAENKISYPFKKKV